MISLNKKQKGFFLIEVVIATALTASVVIFLLGLVQDTVEISATSLERTQASYLLEEGQEATKIIRDGSWNNVSSLVNGTTYYLSWNGSSWVLNTTASTIESFNRTVMFDGVYRDINDDITTSGGTLDTKTRKVTVLVSWITSTGLPKNESLVFYIADIRT